VSCAGIMLGTLLDLLGVVRGVAWSRPEEEFAGEIGEKEQEVAVLRLRKRSLKC